MSGKFAAQLFIKNSNLMITFYTNTFYLDMEFPATIIIFYIAFISALFILNLFYFY